MSTQYYTATSVDGFIATEDDSLDWLFPLGDVNDTSYGAFIELEEGLDGPSRGFRVTEIGVETIDVHGRISVQGGRVELHRADHPPVKENAFGGQASGKPA